MVDGVFSGDRAVERDKVTFQSVGDVVATSSGMVHGGHVLGSLKLTFKKRRKSNLDVHQSGEVSRLLKAIETSLLDHRSEELVCAP